MRLVPTLTLSLLTILWLERIALLLFLSAKEVSPSLPTAYFVALRPPFPIRQVRCVDTFLLKSAPFCMLLAGLGTTNITAPSLSFSSRTLILSLLRFLLLRPSFYFTLSDISDENYPFPLPLLLSGYRGFPVNYFSRKMTLLISWPDRVHCSSHPLSRVVFLLLPLVSTLFSDWKRTA